MNVTFEKISNDIEEGKFKIPHMNEVLTRSLLLLDDEKSHISDIVNVLKQDASITTRLLQVANSAIFGPVSTVKTLDHALVKMGTSLSRSIIYAFMFKDLLQFKNNKAKLFFNEVWEKNLETAALAVLIAKLVNYKRPDEVFVAGLIHNLGLLLLISYISNFSDEDIEQFIQNYRLGLMNDLIKQVSLLVISKWHIPYVFYECAELWDIPAISYDEITPSVIINAVTSYILIKDNILDKDFFNELRLVKEFQLTPETMEYILSEKKLLIENMKKLLK